VSERARLIYAGLALGTIALGLLVHLRGGGLPATVRDVLGDALWAAMIVWWVSALAPAMRPWRRYLFAYLVCALVELSQRFHTPALDALRATRLGHLVLGSGFDARDLLAYACGVGAAGLGDLSLVKRGVS
jgi:hypothetical protein